jgi:pyruvate dehydrogenase E2 component (dihydrolipoamide acetyltransferase)
MAIEVLMPRLSDSMEEGTIVEWLVEPGGAVRRGQPLVEIETDKANMTYDAHSDGVLLEVLAEVGESLPVGHVIARIGEPGERREPVGAMVAPVPRARRGGAGITASPVARRLARELGVELAALKGSGPSGRIVKADVQAAAEDGTAGASPAPSPAEPVAREAGGKGEAQVIELSRLQQTVSRRMSEAKATAPDFTLVAEVETTRAVELRDRLRRLGEQPPSLNDMIVKAAALALRAHPRVNGAYRDGKLELYSRVNVGIAVAADDALVVPTIYDADRKSLGEISRDARALASKVGDGSITPPEVASGTFTVSNLGMYGVEQFTAVINPPQAAILTAGSMRKRLELDDSGQVVARDVMTISLVCDHRILYGADGAKFLGRVRELLEEPLALTM